MFSTYNYRPNNIYYTHKGQILKRTAKATPTPVKYSMSDIIGLNQWISLNNYNNDNYPPNPGDNDIINVDLTQITNVTLLTTNSDNQNYTITSSVQSNVFGSNSMDFYSIVNTGSMTTTNKYLTAASVTLVQKPDNKIYIGYELLSVYNSGDNGFADYQLPQQYYSTITVSDVFEKFYFNVTQAPSIVYINPVQYYIKEVNGITFDYNDQSYIIPFNASINESLLSAPANSLYYRKKVSGRETFYYSWSGDLVFQDYILATINKNES